MDSERPLVSILTPSYQQGRFIGDCLTSVANQTYRPIEHIVMDAGSTDETLDVLREAPAHVRWTSEPDRGQSHALNKALAASSGEIIGWVNSDDAYADRRAVEWAVESLRDDVVAVFGHALLVNENNEVLQTLATLPFWPFLVRTVHYVYQPTCFFRRDVLGDFVREDLSFVMDRDLLLRLAAKGRIHHMRKVIAVDRHQADRKVLSEAFLRESGAHDTELGIRTTVGRRLLAAAARATMRLYGVPLFMGLGGILQPAYALEIPSLYRRMIRQCLTRRYSMPFRSPENLELRT